MIRTAVLADGEWRVGAGGAIVLDSDPVLEYEEMLLKAMAPMRAYRLADAGRDRLTAGGELMTTMRAGDLWQNGCANLASRGPAPSFP